MPLTLKKRLNIQLTLKRSEPARGKTHARPTPSGWGFFGLIGCAFLMSVNFSNNLIFALTFLLTGIALVGWYHTRSNVKGLVCADWRCEPVFAGRNAVYRLPVENPARAPRHGLLAEARGSVAVGEQSFAAGERSEIVLERPAPRRGRLESAPARLGGTFPLGLFRARMFTGPLPECLVYPAPVGEQPIPDQAVGRQAHLLAESGEYQDLRRYAPGDPLSHIHWKAMARFDELYTKEFDGAQGEPALWLRWDDVLARGTEEKLSQLCRWVLDARGKNKEYGLELPGGTIEPGDGEAHLRACLEVMALYAEVDG